MCVSKSKRTRLIKAQLATICVRKMKYKDSVQCAADRSSILIISYSPPVIIYLDDWSCVAHQQLQKLMDSGYRVPSMSYPICSSASRALACRSCCQPRRCCSCSACSFRRERAGSIWFRRLRGWIQQAWAGLGGPGWWESVWVDPTVEVGNQNPCHAHCWRCSQHLPQLDSWELWEIIENGIKMY